jgi:predicted transcriptional regulator
MRYRSRIEIIAQILQAVNGSGGITQTQIMYKALLGYAQMKQYLLRLAENALLQYDNTTRTFNITEKGIRFLNICSKINQTQSSPTVNAQGQGRLEEEEEFVSSSYDKL